MTTDQTITALLEALNSIVHEAADYTAAAVNAARSGKRNEAIGWLSIDHLLHSARALHDTALIMHRHGGKGGAQ
jgi:hypothetical protein